MVFSSHVRPENIGRVPAQSAANPPPARRPERHLCQKQGFRMGVVQNSENLILAPRLGDSTPSISATASRLCRLKGV